MASKKKKSSNDRIWFWKKNLTMKDANPKAWQQYDDSVCAKLNKGYNEDPDDEDYSLDTTYAVDFVSRIQFRKDDHDKQRPIKFEEKTPGAPPKKKAKKKVTQRKWYWKKNLTMKNTNKKAWAEYDEEVSKKLSAAYAEDPNATDYELDDTYSIDFVENIQYRTDDRDRQRDIKSEEMKGSDDGDEDDDNEGEAEENEAEADDNDDDDDNDEEKDDDGDSDKSNEEDKNDEDDDGMDVDDAEEEKPYIYTKEEIEFILLELAKPIGTEKHRYTNPPKGTIEKILDKVSELIRQKPNWETKIEDGNITKKWLKEVKPVVKQVVKNQNYNFKQNDMDYILAELKFKAEEMKDEKFRHSPVNGVYEADNLFPGDVTEKLAEGVKKLESGAVDWHPGSNELVRDLVHPSLYCYVSTKCSNPPDEFNPTEKSKNSRFMMEVVKRKCNAPTEKSMEFLNQFSLNPKFSEDPTPLFQWLPSDFQIDANGKVAVKSHINSLPKSKHKEMYRVLEKMVEHLVPMLERVLSDMATRYIYTRKFSGPIISPEWEWEEFEDWIKREKKKISKKIKLEDDETWSENDDANELYDETKKLVKGPKCPEKYTPPMKEMRVPFSLKNRTLQIIVKFANIHLTPEKPKYSGGSWHIEGAPQESIVASVIYYHDMSNITESKLSFRSPIDSEDVYYEQNDERGVQLAYDFELDDDRQAKLSEPIGSIIAKKDRVVVFPNLLQHQVQPFELEDKSKPGYRKIMALFIVDPLTPILSTKHTGYLQHELFSEELHTIPPFNTLPFELILKICSFIKNLMSWEEAQEYREKLMEQRSPKKDTNDNDFYDDDGSLYESVFSLCEH
eukprot:m.80965 g.80965  ORF g.80965 m.80965 type:complete len:842 (-) comp12786_c0_seq2:90-2615(-)